MDSRSGNEGQGGRRWIRRPNINHCAAKEVALRTFPSAAPAPYPARLFLGPQPKAFRCTAGKRQRLQVRIGRCGFGNSLYEYSQKSDAAAASVIGAMNGIAR